ncbi:MAG TPA: hypothetical protein DC046_18065 [Rhodospirillaceae bacterium]|uniref:hypothetical protein n=1 Tax=Hyphomonas sp. TaxID=87 RepID=UPI000E8C50DD|nr:hypothetical protein [Rhodospirillaceae bacterium]|tara:strand:- start:255 stop:608 length:354 start_codon:yes stop_codon:yes gene_type:complete
MRRLLRSRLLIVALLLAVGVGSVVSVVQAGQMRVDMAMTGDVQGPDGDSCTACGTGGDGAKASIDCVSACHLSAIDMVDGRAAAGMADDRTYPLDRRQFARSSGPLLDPSPPKSILG